VAETKARTQATRRQRAISERRRAKSRSSSRVTSTIARRSPSWTLIAYLPHLRSETDTPFDTDRALTILTPSNAKAALSFADKIRGFLKKLPEWNRIQATPERVDSLEKRIAELENRLQRAPGKACPACGALEYWATATKPHPDFGLDLSIRTMKCRECGFTEERSVDR